MSKRTSTLAIAIASVIALVAFWGMDLVTWFRARHAPVAALPDPPNLTWSISVLVAAAIVAGVLVYGLLRRRGPGFRGYRLGPILLVVALFVELFVFGEQRSPLSSSQQLGVALQYFAKLASAQSKGDRVPDDPALLAQLVEQIGRPPYLAYGHAPAAYRLQVREGCEGPVREAPGSSLGALIYCISKDRRTAWVTAVALPAEEKFGRPALFSRGGIVQWAEVTPEPPAGGSEGAPALTPDGAAR